MARTGTASASTRAETALGPTVSVPPTASKTRHAHRLQNTIHHSQIAKPERGENTIAVHVKQAIIEKSPARLQSYEAQEVAVRTHQDFALKDSNAVKLEKAKRRMDVHRCGFRADAKESYKALGDPILDSSNLMYTALRIDPSLVERSGDLATNEITNKAHEIRPPSRRQLTDFSGRRDNGFELIKEKLNKSKGRIHAVKFGIPFSQTVDDMAWRRRMDAAKEGRKDVDLQEGHVDWHHLKIDTDKQAYFQNVLERELPGLIAQRHRKGVKSKSYQSKFSHPREPHRWGTIVYRKPPTAPEPEGKVEEKGELPTLSSATSSAIIPETGQHMSRQAMEEELDIHRGDGISIATDQYYLTREHFYEQRRRLTQVLLEDLNRLDYERKSNFLRKYRAFGIGKQNTMFSDDITYMRRRAEAVRRAEKNRLLRQHPWYNELLNKVVMNGAKRDMSEYEQRLLSRVKSVIEDGLPFTQPVFVQLMKVIPTHEFLKDDIQRIIRFVKAHGNITEREYLEAIEMAGQKYE